LSGSTKAVIATDFWAKKASPVTPKLVDDVLLAWDNFRTEWNVSATIYDADRHLERPCVLIDLSSAARGLPESEPARFPMSSGCGHLMATVDRAG
jgi:hypothetical protein